MAVRARLAGKATSASTSHSVTLPSVTVGDRFIVGFVNDDTTSNPSVLSGWTQVGATEDQGSGTNHSLSVWTRVATGSNSLTVTLSAAQEAEWVVIALVGDPGTPQVVFNDGGTAITGSVGGITGLTSGDWTSIIFLGLDNGGGLAHTVDEPSGYSTTPTTAFASTDVIGCWSMDRTSTGVTGFSPAAVTWSNAEQWITAHVVAAPVSPPPGDPPDDVFDLSNWHLTTPADEGDGSAQQIDQPALATYASDYFYLDVDNLMTCVATVDGFTTSGASGATRSELRQHDKGTYAETAIDPATSGRYQMTVTLYADPTSISGGSDPRQELIVAQIHGAGDSPIPLTFAAEWESGGSPVTPRLQMFKNGPAFDVVIPNITVVTPMTIRIRIESARLKVWAAAGFKEALTSLALPQYNWPVSDFTDVSGWYYKTGAYNKTEIDSGSTGEGITKIAYLEILEPGDPDPAATKSALPAQRRRRRMLPLLVR